MIIPNRDEPARLLRYRLYSESSTSCDVTLNAIDEMYTQNVFISELCMR